jgi:hypothetical protein
MCIKLVIKTNLYYDERSEKYQVIPGGTYIDHCCHVIIKKSLDLPFYNFIL